VKKLATLGLGIALMTTAVLTSVGCSPVLGDAADNPAPVSTQLRFSELVENFVRSGPTYRFDGVDGSLKIVNAVETVGDNWDFTVEYQTNQPGHGDRSGQMLAQVITTHTAEVEIREGKIASAVCDGGWNMVSRTGILEGRINIGPLQPVQRPGVTPPTPSEVYEARKILVYDAEGKNLLDTASIDNTGNYHVELEAGTYTVDINHNGLDRSSEVPQQIEIKAGQAIELNISIDTGIR